MEYDIIEKLSDLAASDLKLDSKLAEAVRLLLEYFPFDQCLLYLDESGVLRLRAGSDGRTGQAVEAYEKGEGLPGRASVALTPVEAFKEPGETSWEGIEDRGLYGARHAFVVPLKASGRVCGILYFKSAGKGALGNVKKQMSRIAALQVVWSWVY
jgi:hypothetical protein